MFGIRTSRYVYGRESLEGTNKSCSRYSPDRLKFRECSSNFPSKTTTEHEQINFSIQWIQRSLWFVFKFAFKNGFFEQVVDGKFADLNNLKKVFDLAFPFTFSATDLKKLAVSSCTTTLMLF